jgi:hypothetical protein
MTLPINNLALQGINTIFALTNEMSHSISITVALDDGTSGEYTYDPVTGTYSEDVTPMSAITVADARILKFRDKEIRDSNGAITPNTRKIYFRYADLGGQSISNSDWITLPNGQVVQINSLKFLPDEFNPVFVSLVVEGVNQP